MLAKNAEKSVIAEHAGEHRTAESDEWSPVGGLIIVHIVPRAVSERDREVSQHRDHSDHGGPLGR